jgi:hypothetical protein
MSSPVLDLQRVHYCFRSGRQELLCDQCKGGEPPGCDLVLQDDAAYGWSESNVQYERISRVEFEYQWASVQTWRPKPHAVELEAEGWIKVCQHPLWDNLSLYKRVVKRDSATV